jgi:glutamate/tyrosine decarboxylase-like PLP-dependent enzyme
LTKSDIGSAVQSPDWDEPLEAAHRAALEFLHGLPRRPVGASGSPSDLLLSLDGALPEEGVDPTEVIETLASTADPGLVGTQSGRFFGFVIGGSTPAGIAAEWLTSAWDQNAGLALLTPAAAAMEEISGRWLIELLGLPEHASVGFVTGAMMANFTALAAARNAALSRFGWNVETDGLSRAPHIRVLAGRDHHDTIDLAIRYLGLGTNCLISVDSDATGRMLPGDLARKLAEREAPTIVCAQAGCVNGGSIDPLAEIIEISHRHSAWVHVDGAFGLWAAATPGLKYLLDGVERADSWATDAHKWLNVPYDSGLVFCAHPEAHRAAMQVRAPYLSHAESSVRDPFDYTPEFSRRARGVAVYATMRALGRHGIAELVDNCCALARRFGEQLSAAGGAELILPVSLNQVVVHFLAANGDHDGHTRRVLAAVQKEGVCWPSPTTWRGQAGIRISVSNAATDEEDVDSSVASMLRWHRQLNQ